MPILGFTSKVLPLYFIFKLEILLFLKFNFKTSAFVKIDKLGLTPLDQEKLFNINHNLIQFKKFVTDSNTQLY